MIVLGGLAVLVCLAIAIGDVDANARDSAWRRIAAARRDHQEREHTMRRCLESPRCAHCPISRYFGEW